MATEIEFKYRVSSSADLDAIEAAASGDRSGELHQVNHFFDTPEHALNSAKMVLRLRLQNGVYILTGKGKASASVDGALTRKVEEEIEVADAVAQALLSGTQDALQTLRDSGGGQSRSALCEAMDQARGGQSLAHIGAFTNTRTKVAHHFDAVNLDVILECDRTVFPGDVAQYEVEVEIPGDVDEEKAASAMRALLKCAGVEGQNAPSKSKRFFAALSGQAI